MPLFLSDEEYQRCSNDAGLLVEKADAFIRDLYVKLETVNAQADAASTTAEQTCSFIEQKYVSLSDQYGKLELENARLVAEVEKGVSELAKVQAENRQLHLNSIGRDGEFERLMAEVSEHQKAKRQMMELVEQKESEISEKNALIKTYLDKIVSLTENASMREGKLNDIETELHQSKAMCNRLSQEKELIERHNAWLNDELTVKVNNLIEIRGRHSEIESEMASKLSDVERQYGECSKSLKWHKERVKELETKLGSLEEELLLSKSSAANDEERFAAELATANKLVELYKERSEELAKKAAELEGVIQALESHLSQVENDSKERIQKEISAKTELENETAALKEKLEKCEAELEAARKQSDLTLHLSDYTTDIHLGSFESINSKEETQMLVPTVPAGISGTALAASLLRDGWSLTKIYCKYQEAVDALQHEQLGRKNVESLMQRILHEIEAKAEAILDERAEHERILDVYSVINEKLQQSLSEKSNLEKIIRGLQAELRRNERDYASAQNDIADLQKQVTLLLKECLDVQIRCGIDVSSNLITPDIEVNNDPGAATSDRLLTFNDINGLVEQNVKLRSLVRKFSDEVEIREMEMKEKFEVEIKKHTEVAASRITAVLQRAEEQAQMKESLHTSVAMYKKLYEEEQKWCSSPSQASPDPERRINEVAKMFEGSHGASRLALEPSNESKKQLEEGLAKTRIDLLSMRNDRDKLALEAKFARERLESFMKELELKRDESNSILARNIELSQIIVDYQKKIRDSSDALHAAEDLSRKLTMEVSVLKHEKEMLSNAEKRACEEVRSLSERVHRLQASLDTIHSTEEVRKEAQILELKKKEEHIKKIEREWAEVKKELQEERDNSRTLTLAREAGVNNAMRQVEEIGKRLSDALHDVSAAEARAAVAEARYKDLEKRIISSDVAVTISGGDHSTYSSEITTDMHSAKEEITKLREELQVTKDHMVQYKSIAQVNEAALKQIEAAHEEYKTEAEQLKFSQEAEISALRDKICQLQDESILMSKEAASASHDKDVALESANAEITRLKHECAAKTFDYEEMKVRVVALKEDLEREHQRWAASQANYERQVILQSETIQELTKTSKALSLLQDEASELRRVSDASKRENSEFKREWEAERLVLEQLKNEAEKKYNEVDEQNKILHNRLEALHIQLAERDHNSSRTTMENSSLHAADDSGMQSVVNYLRRSKEIAETEISLFKQEKLRLQSQLESALSATEIARASLQAERSSSRAMLLTEDEIKSLQLQVTEMSLLRESNMQLREENKHNFEECQKLREVAQNNLTEVEHLQGLLRDKESEIEACRKEIEEHKIENDLLKKVNTELRQNFRDIDVNEYNRMKEEVNKMQAQNHLQLEETNKLLGERQEQISRLEKEVANCTAELQERTNKINELLQAEASMKSEMERQKRSVMLNKRRYEMLLKEKEDLNRVNAALQKQLNEQKGKGSEEDVTNDQALKEKKEKDTRIQILEKTVERLRDGKTKLEKIEKVVTEEKTKFVDELEKHKQALENLLLDVEKAKQTASFSLEGNASLQILTGNSLDETAATYLGTCEDLEKMAKTVIDDIGGSSSSSLPTSAAIAPASLGAPVAVSHPTGVTHPVISTIQLPFATNEDRDRRVSLPKPSVEARRPGRKLIRPRLVKQEEPQGDVEMNEMEGTSQASATDTETRIMYLPTEQAPRKRHAASVPVEVPDVSGDCSDASLPAPKKLKGSNAQVESSVVGLACLESGGIIPATDEQIALVTDITQDAIDEGVDVLKDYDDAQAVEDVQAGEEEPKELSQPEDSIQVDASIEPDNLTEEIDKQDDTEMSTPDDSQEEVQPLAESDKEEGELDSDGGSDMYNQGRPLIEEVQSEPSENVPLSPNNEGLTATSEGNDANSLNVVDRGSEGRVLNEVAEGSNRSNDGNDNDKIAKEADIAVKISTGGSETAPKADSNTVADANEAKQAVTPPGSTTINLNERAREMARRRQAGMISTSVPRGRVALRGRPRGRGVRGRGQTPPSDQS